MTKIPSKEGSPSVGEKDGRPLVKCNGCQRVHCPWNQCGSAEEIRRMVEWLKENEDRDD